MLDQLIFHPPSVRRGEWYRFLSCGLIHADIGHLVFNMISLYLFGIGSKSNTPDGVYHTGLEYQFGYIFGETGKYIYFVMYLLALVVSLIPTYARHSHDYQYRSLGASGAVSAVVFASILLNPMTGIGLFFIPLYVAGFIFGILYLIVSNLLEKRGQGHINHSAHIFGALFGVGFTIIACQFFTDYNVIKLFIDQIRTANPKDFIHFGN